MKHKYPTLYIIFLLFTTSCVSSPQSLAEIHLEQIKLGKVSQANQQYCMPSDTLRLHTVKSSKVISSQQKTQDNLSYIEVIANIETDQYRFKSIDKEGISIPQKEVLNQVKLEIWKSDDFYQSHVKNTAKLNDLTNSTAALTGIQGKTFLAPKREEINKESLCIFLPFEQFKDDK